MCLGDMIMLSTLCFRNLLGICGFNVIESWVQMGCDERECLQCMGLAKANTILRLITELNKSLE